jgi:hypothetical protein
MTGTILGKCSVIAFPAATERKDREWQKMKPAFTAGLAVLGHGPEEIIYAMARLDFAVAQLGYKIPCEDTLSALAVLAGAYCELWHYGAR